MAIVVVGGSGKDVGKTELVCAVMSALPEFAWTAVKITGHEYNPGSAATSQSIWEETRAGFETDTARYLTAGARRGLLITRTGAKLPIEQIRQAIGKDHNVIFESNRIVDAIKPDVCLALVGESAERKASFLRLLRVTDAAVSRGNADVDAPAGIRKFRLESFAQLSTEFVAWLRERLAAAH